MESSDKIKQIIVIRKDLKCRRGKEIAQGCHSSMEFLRKRIDNFYLTDIEKRWFNDGHAKICVTVDSEEELIELYEKAKEAGLEAHIIIDEGLTEFHGQYTKTALAIGPNLSSLIDPITGHLKLY
jgi:PTH2 family peptidyl-tRNA hydrolase